jgi:hypothetical protein
MYARRESSNTSVDSLVHSNQLRAEFNFGVVAVGYDIDAKAGDIVSH